jgi:hypothetical protein
VWVLWAAAAVAPCTPPQITSVSRHGKCCQLSLPRCIRGLKAAASSESHVLLCCDVLPACAAAGPCSAFEPDATQYLLMLALVPSSIGLLLSLGMNYVPFVETSEVAHPNSRWSARSRCGQSTAQQWAADSLSKPACAWQ